MPHASFNLSLSAIAGMNFGLTFLVISIPSQIFCSDYTSCRPLLIIDREKARGRLGLVYSFNHLTNIYSCLDLAHFISSENLSACKHYEHAHMQSERRNIRETNIQYHPWTLQFLGTWGQYSMIYA